MHTLADITEKEWDAQLFNNQKGLATTLGWTLCYHTLRSKGSASGFPDRVLARDRVIFAELKREDGKPTERQIAWLTGLAAAGAEVYLWRPSDLDEIARILTKHSMLWEKRLSALGIGTQEPGPPDWWRPKSLWLPQGHRADQQNQEAIAA